MAGCYAGFEGRAGPPPPGPDYTRPLHVDCSVEYELPNAAKPPAGARAEPLLMIHPCYFRKIESQRRSPFVNNLPAVAVAPRRRRPPDPADVWTELSDRSPDRPEDAAVPPIAGTPAKHILAGKYRQFLRAHRLHPYAAVPVAQGHHQPVCYNA